MTSTKTETKEPRPTGRSRAQRRVLWACCGVAAVVAILILALTVDWGGVSIVTGWFPDFLIWLTVAVAVIAGAVAIRPICAKSFDGS